MLHQSEISKHFHKNLLQPDKIDYCKKVGEILQGSSKFKRLNDDPIKVTLQRENKVRNFLRTLKKTEAISQTTNEKLVEECQATCG